jgi:hypothetical protein
MTVVAARVIVAAVGEIDTAFEVEFRLEAAAQIFDALQTPQRRRVARVGELEHVAGARSAIELRGRMAQIHQAGVGDTVQRHAPVCIRRARRTECRGGHTRLDREFPLLRHLLESPVFRYGFKNSCY